MTWIIAVLLLIGILGWAKIVVDAVENNRKARRKDRFEEGVRWATFGLRKAPFDPDPGLTLIDLDPDWPIWVEEARRRLERDGQSRNIAANEDS